MPTEAADWARGECKQSLPHAANGAQADGPERHCAPTDCGPAAQGRHGSMPPQKQGCCAKQAVSHCHTAHFATQYGLFCIVKRPVSQTNANAVVTHCHPICYCVLYKLKEKWQKTSFGTRPIRRWPGHAQCCPTPPQCLTEQAPHKPKARKKPKNIAKSLVI